jgi:glycosyltransferase involved in cell wall biosynthesis
MTTLHILSSPYSPVNINNTADPFSIAAIKFIKYMTQYGWDCVHYGIKGTEVPCEMIECDNIIDGTAENISRYNQKAGLEISRRKKSSDMILCFHGIENKEACDLNPDLAHVEPSIGYNTNAIFAPYRSFVSYAQQHMFYGARGMLMTPSWFDSVIYNAIDSAAFEFTEKKEDYFLVFGRMITAKGIDLAIQATEATNKKLIVAGPGSLADLGYTSIPKHVEVLGTQNAEQRKKLMAGARAMIGMTHYVEPFGNMIVEGYMAGTPAITSDWGGFAETVTPGVTGFRCRDYKDVINAIENIDTIKPQACRDWALANCDDTVVHPQFDTWFKKLQIRDFYHV